MSKIICILGMHRSGTSCLTGSLQALGVELGKHHTWNPYNRKGNRENQDIVDLNIDILKTNHGSWDNPPENVGWQEYQLEQARELLKGYEIFDVWGFKDPVTLITLEGWKKVIPQVLDSKLERIGIFRHPASVCKSLNSREFMETEKVYSLWQAYNQRLLDEYKSSPFPILYFGGDEKAFHQALAHAIEDIGLDSSPLENQDSFPFYTPDLHHHKDHDLEELPSHINNLYKELKAIAIK